VLVFRGVGHPGFARGLSWTLDRYRAVWFAGYAPLAAARGGIAADTSQPSVVCATVARADVIAYLEGRSEREVIALPEAIAVECVEPVTID
jgi:hypothetical protein